MESMVIAIVVVVILIVCVIVGMIRGARSESVHVREGGESQGEQLSADPH
jgi:uncharacterized membrane protein YqiK